MVDLQASMLLKEEKISKLRYITIAVKALRFDITNATTLII